MKALRALQHHWLALLDFLLAILGLCLAGCAEQGHLAPRGATLLRRMQPETMSLGITAPNLFAGPVQNSKGNAQSRRDSTGQIGGTVSFTWRFAPIRIERADAQPTDGVRPFRVLRATPVNPPPQTPHASPTPIP